MNKILSFFESLQLIYLTFKADFIAWINYDYYYIIRKRRFVYSLISYRKVKLYSKAHYRKIIGKPSLKVSDLEKNAIYKTKNYSK